MTTDLSGSYSFLDHYVFTVGGSNIFNTYPDKIQNTLASPIYTLTGGQLRWFGATRAVAVPSGSTARSTTSA